MRVKSQKNLTQLKQNGPKAHFFAQIGAIIGRGGSRIAEIRRYSTQDIKIHEKDEQSSTRRITVNGQQDQIGKQDSYVQHTNIAFQIEQFFYYMYVSMYTQNRKKKWVNGPYYKLCTMRGVMKATR